MFIIKLGQEALTKLEEQLTEPMSKSNNYYNSRNQVHSSILYNLLASDEKVKIKSYLYNNNAMNVESETIPRPNTVMNHHSNISDSTSSPRPFSAPDILIIPKIKSEENSSNSSPVKTQKVSNHFYSSYSMNSPSVSCSTDSFVEEPMDLSQAHSRTVPLTQSTESVSESIRVLVNSLLINIVEIINTNRYIIPINELQWKIRLHLLQTSWHKMLIMLFYEQFIKFEFLNESLPENLWRFIHNLTGVRINNVKMLKLCKNLVNELYEIFVELYQLHLDENSLNCFRIVVFLAGDNDEFNWKLLSQFLTQSNSHSKEFQGQLKSILDKFVKINSVIIETVFFSHLQDPVEQILEKLVNARLIQ